MDTNGRGCWIHWNFYGTIFTEKLSKNANNFGQSSRSQMFETRVLRRVFGPKRDEVTGEWRKLHNEEHSDLYSLPNIVRVVKSRRMRWAGHVARMGGRERCAQGSGGET